MVPGMMVNLAKPKAMELARRLLDWGEELGVQIRLPQREAHALGCQGDDLQTWCRTVDAAIVIGGDGTFLRAARRILDQGKDIPLFGINVGHLGFLATGTVEGAQSELTQILEGRYTVQKRHTLECRYIRGEEQKQYYALNDFVLYKGTQAKLISVAVEVPGRRPDRGDSYRLDGVRPVCRGPDSPSSRALHGPGSHLRPYAVFQTDHSGAPRPVEHEAPVRGSDVLLSGRTGRNRCERRGLPSGKPVRTALGLGDHAASAGIF